MCGLVIIDALDRFRRVCIERICSAITSDDNNQQDGLQKSLSSFSAKYVIKDVLNLFRKKGLGASFFICSKPHNNLCHERKHNMKNILKNVSAFIKLHKLASCLVGGAMIFTMAATPICIHLIKKKENSSPPVFYAEILPENEKNKSADQVEDQAQEEGTDPKVEETPSEPMKDENTSTNASGTIPDSGGTVANNEQGGLTFHGSNYDPNKPVAVQTANTMTGISWDGKSPIVYTYADGTTGTTPKEGALYEVIPGVYGTYSVALDSAGRNLTSNCTTCGKKVGTGINNTCLQYSTPSYCGGCGILVQAYTCHTCASPSGITYCQYCGRLSGHDGSNGQCVRWSLSTSDHNCSACGAIVPAATCHTCSYKSYCASCGKISGDGTNGTCLQFWAFDDNCPNCGLFVPTNTCHTCS